MSPEVTAALDWAVANRHELALPLARALAVLVQQYSPQLDSLDWIARAARDPYVRNAAAATDLLEMGLALCYGDLDLVAGLAARAFELAADDRAVPGGDGGRTRPLGASIAEGQARGRQAHRPSDGVAPAHPPAR